MKDKIQEDFGQDDRNFHPEEQRINWETMSNTDPAIEEQYQFVPDTSSDPGDDAYTNRDTSDAPVKEQPIEPELDRDIDEELDKELEDFSDEEFDKKDKSDS